MRRLRVVPATQTTAVVPEASLRGRIETAEQLESLPVDAIVIDCDGQPWTRRGLDYLGGPFLWFTVADMKGRESDWIYAGLSPLHLIHKGGPL